MKNFFKILMAVAVLFTASCAKEDISASLGKGQVEVTFTANLANLNTRAGVETFGKGTNVDVLYYYVYDAANNAHLSALSSSVERGTDGKFTFTLPMMKGMLYDIVFWAQKTGAPYGYDPATKEISVTYGASNDDTRDAFYKFVDNFDPTAAPQTIQLYRPFAQLNAATNDLEKVQKNLIALTTSQVTVKAYTQFNLETGVPVEASLTDVTFTATNIPANNNEEEILKAGFTYLSMNYMFAPKGGMVTDATYLFKGKRDNGAGAEVEFTGTSYSNIPLKQNYRTNILGALLTKDTEIKVEILPGFGTPDEVVEVWDGKTVTEPAYDPATETYTVKNGAELAWIAQTVSGVTRTTQADLVGKTIVLSKDIELGGNEWLPIGHPVGGSSYTNAFKGTFDGQGHSVMNFVVNNSKCAGLFGCLVGATVKNVTVSNAKITSNHYAGAIAGWAESGATLNNIINCHVKNSQITISAEQLANGNWDNGDKAGAIAGFWYFGSIEGCTATDVTVKAYRDLGGIVGIAQGGAVVSNNEIKNVTLIQDNSHNYKNYTKAEELNVNSFVGRKAANDNGVLPTIENNKGLAEIVIDLEGLATTPMEMIQNTPGATVTLPAQEEPYVLPQTIADGVTIVGEGADTKVNISKGYGQSVASAKNVTFKNLTINKDNTLYVGFHHVQTETYIGCVINGSLWTYGNAYFEDCTFNQTGNEYGLRIYGKGDVEINDCTFNCAGKAVLIYSEGAGEYNVDVNDCTFNSSVKKDDKSAIQMHTEKGIYGTLKITNTTATGFADINNGLWNEVINSNDNIYSATEGTLTNNFEKWVDGVQVYNEYSIVDGIYEVYTVAGLQTVLDKATKDTNIKFVNDLNGDVKVTERDHKGIDFVIDGNGKKYDGQIKIQGNSDEGDETLLIKNINFETSTKSREFIWSADSSNGSMWRYANNVTIKDCTFTAVEGSEAVHTAVGVKFQQAYDITLEKCTATNLHSLLQAESCGTTITVDGATVVNGKNAISLNNTMNAIVRNSNIESVVKGGYGIRHKGEVENYKLSVENCTVKAFVPVLIRNMTASSYTCTLSGTNNLIETNEDHDWQIVICNGDYDGTNEPVAPTGNCTLTGAESFNVFK